MPKTPSLDQPGPDKTAGTGTLTDPRTAMVMVPIFIAICLVVYFWY